MLTVPPKHTAVVADDTPGVVERIRHLADQCGFGVTGAATIGQTWAAVRKVKPDAILIENLGGVGHYLAATFIEDGYPVIWICADRGVEVPPGTIPLPKPIELTPLMVTLANIIQEGSVSPS